MPMTLQDEEIVKFARFCYNHKVEPEAIMKLVACCREASKKATSYKLKHELRDHVCQELIALGFYDISFYLHGNGCWPQFREKKFDDIHYLPFDPYRHKGL